MIKKMTDFNCMGLLFPLGFQATSYRYSQIILLSFGFSNEFKIVFKGH